MKLNEIKERNNAALALVPDYVPTLSNKKREQLEFIEQANNLRNQVHKKEAFPEGYRRFRGNITATCKALDIATATYYDWLSKDEKFVENMELARQALVDNARETIFSQAEEGHTIASIFILKTHDHRFSENTKEDKINPSFNINFNGTVSSWGS
jgi:hypothetical protein